MSLTPTDQQSKILDNCAKDAKIQVNAAAGSGKTSVIFMTADHLKSVNRSMKIFYTAFNREIVKEVKDKTETIGIQCKTWHSLALSCQKHEIMPKITFLGEFAKFYTGKQLMDHFALSVNYTKFTRSEVGWEIIKTIRNFCNSDQMEINDKNFSKELRIKLRNIDGQNILNAERDEVRALVLRYAARTWELIIDEKYKSFPMSHDHYLKRMDLIKIDIGKEYDMFMVDEFQDTNPVCFNIMNNSKFDKSMIVADINQSIYSFRGNIVNMDRLKGYKKYNLTKSFRVSPEIADLSNRILDIFYKDGKERIEGHGPGILDDSKAFISRTNAGVMEVVSEKLTMDKNVYCPKYQNVSSVILEIYDLYKTGNHKAFSSWYDLEEYVEFSDDLEYRTSMEFVNKHRDNTVQIVNKMKALKRTKESEIITNVHISKGLEFEYVEINDDFIPFIGLIIRDILGDHITDSENERLYSMNKREEINLLYVAVTRCSRVLKLPERLNDLIIRLNK